MRGKLTILIAGILVVGVMLGLPDKTSATQAAEGKTRKIVVFKSGVLNEPAREALVKRFGGVKIKDLTLIDGMAVLLPPQVEATLAREAGVLRIDDDVVVEALAKPAPNQPVQTLPWGVDRIDAELVWGTTTADPIKVAIVDTGIDLTHPDLADNLKGGVSTVWYTTSFNDDNGHGTHVAGIAAALDSAIGVVGVGPKIDLYAVKVLDRRGSGYLSDVIEGLQWVIDNGMQVANMSLGTSSDVTSFKEAIQKVNQAGITQVAAAGNTGGSVIYPAAYPEVIAVSATDKTDTIASWSSRGPEVDLAAPGVGIYATYKGGRYKVLSGTSMAAPHVAGTAALVLSVPEKCDFDLSGSCSPAEVQQRLKAMAEDLGVSGWDELYGAGLVDAERAVIQ